MKAAKFLRSALIGLSLVTSSLTARAALFDIDHMSGYLNIPSLNMGISGSDMVIDTRNHLTGGSATFALGAPDFGNLSATFTSALITNADNRFTGGSVSWTIFNHTASILNDIKFFLFLDALAATDNSAGSTNTGGGSAGDYFEIGTFNNHFFDILSSLDFGTVSPNTGPKAPVITDDPFDTLLFALGVNIGSLDIGQGFQLTYNFGDSGLFGRDTDGNNVFYLDVAPPAFVPEPISLALMALGLATLASTRRRSKQK